MSKQTILKTEIKNNCIYIIKLNNPKKRNPLSLKLINILQEELNNLKKNKNVKVVIIKSTGPSFCSGHDLKEVKSFSKSKSSRNHESVDR